MPNSSSEDQPNRNRTVILAAGILAVILLSVVVVLAPVVIPLTFMIALFAVYLRSLGTPLADIIPGIVPRYATVVVAAITFSTLIGFGVLAGPQISNEMDALNETIPQALTSVEQELRQYGWGDQLIESLSQVDTGVGSIDIFSQLSGVVSSTLSALTNISIVIVGGMYVAFEPAFYTNNLIRLVPSRSRDRASEILDELYDILRRWLVARLISMLVVGLLTFIGLTLINMPLALILAIIAALLSFIPNIGPILSVVPAVLVGLTISPAQGALAIIVYTVVQLAENYLITPFVERNTVYLPPAATMVMQVIMTLTFGWFGLFIAAPFLAALIVLVKCLYIEDILGDDLGRIGAG